MNQETYPILEIIWTEEKLKQIADKLRETVTIFLRYLNSDFAKLNDQYSIRVETSNTQSELVNIHSPRWKLILQFLTVDLETYDQILISSAVLAHLNALGFYRKFAKLPNKTIRVKSILKPNLVSKPQHLVLRSSCGLFCC